VHCGGLTRNDFAVHAIPNGAPFGGVGASGSGYYHGRAGFDTFSHLRTTASTSLRISVMGFAAPPFSARTESAMRRVVGLMSVIASRRARRSSRST
jgi:coniferyl-aldehyde dehydrogenase